MIVCMLTHSLVSLEHSLRLMVRYTMHMRVIKSNKPIPLLVMLQLIYKSQLEWWLNGDGDVREAHSSHTLMGWYVAIAIISVVTTITTAASSHTHTLTKSVFFCTCNTREYCGICQAAVCHWHHNQTRLGGVESWPRQSFFE